MYSLGLFFQAQLGFAMHGLIFLSSSFYCKRRVTCQSSGVVFEAQTCMSKLRLVFVKPIRLCQRPACLFQPWANFSKLRFFVRSLGLCCISKVRHVFELMLVLSKCTVLRPSSGLLIQAQVRFTKTLLEAQAWLFILKRAF